MWEIWANLLFAKVLKSCPKSKKSPNLVTLCWIFIAIVAEKGPFNAVQDNAADKGRVDTAVHGLSNLD